MDNGSTDGSDRMVAERYPEFRLLRLPSNRGFTAAVNEGILASRGDLVALLNNDAEADPGWLGPSPGRPWPIRRPASSPARSCCTTGETSSTRRGTSTAPSGVPGNRGVWQRDEGQFDREEYVLGACGAASGWRRSLFDDVGLLDESLFMYCEDVDISLRAQLRGHRGLYVPTSWVYHRLSATGGGTLASYYCGRNFIAVAAKNLPGELLRRHWRALIGTQIAFAVHSMTAPA